MSIRIRVLVCVLPFFLSLAGRADAAESAATSGATLLVVPSRYTVVQFAFDIARLRPAFLMAYDGSESGREPVLHAWDKSASDWIQADVDAYRTGSLFKTVPSLVVVVGGDEDLPAALVGKPDWECRFRRIMKLDVVTLVNSLDEELEFAPYEWKWLGKRHRLKLRDSSADRRRYGRYGRPGAKRRPEETESDTLEDSVEPVPIDLDEEAERQESPVEVELEPVARVPEAVLVEADPDPDVVPEPEAAAPEDK